MRRTDDAPRPMWGRRPMIVLHVCAARSRCLMFLSGLVAAAAGGGGAVIWSEGSAGSIAYEIHVSRKQGL
eukprot:199187-Prymnesium_polylepis.1